MAKSKNLTPKQRSLRAKRAALVRWSREDPTPTVTKANEAFMRRFIDAVDPDRVLSESERERRAEAARRAYFTDLAYRSSRARSRRQDVA